MSTLGSFIWSIADQLRGPYRPNQYGNVILPFTILRRLDCILEPDRETVRDLAAAYENPNRLRIEVKKATGRPFYNTSKYSFANLLKDADGLEDNLVDYVDRFSADVDVFEYFDFKKEIIALEKAGLLREIVKSFGAVDLHPDVVSNADMGDASSTSSASSTRPRTRPPVTTTRRVTRSGCWSTCSSPRRTPT